MLAQSQMVIETDVSVLSVILGLVIPILVALITKSTASSTVKALLNALLAAITGGVALLIANGGEMELKPLLASIAIAFVVSGAAHNHLWKPLGISAAIANYFPGGIGKPSQPAPLPPANPLVPSPAPEIPVPVDPDPEPSPPLEPFTDEEIDAEADPDPHGVWDDGPPVPPPADPEAPKEN